MANDADQRSDGAPTDRSTAQLPAELPRNRQDRDIGSLHVLINGIIAAVVGAYVATRSIVVTLTAGFAALLVTSLIMFRR